MAVDLALVADVLPDSAPAPVPSSASGRCAEVAVLGTKLHVPATRRPLVARPRLTELVRSGASELDVNTRAAAVSRAADLGLLQAS
jgi:hypothetical protein